MPQEQLMKTTPIGQRLLILGLLLVTGTIGYLRLTTSFAKYDDEGYVMVSLQSFMDGKPLYDETFSQYGPGYFFLNSWFHHLTGLSVSHDSVRLKMLSVWFLTAGAAGWTALRLTGQRWLGLLVYVAAWFHLDRLGFEPGHPQDLCFAAIAMTMLVASTTPKQTAGAVSRAIALGVLAGVAATTKINIGVYLLIIATATVLVQAQTGRIRTWLLALTATGAAALPVVIAKHHVLSFDGMQLPLTVLFGWIAVAIVFVRKSSDANRVSESADTVDSNSSTVRHLLNRYGTVLAVWLGFAATFATFCGLAIANGTSHGGLYFGLIGQHQGFIDSVYEHPPLHPFAFAVSVVGTALAWFLTRPSASTQHVALARKGMTFGFIILLAGIGLRYATDSVTAIEHGANDRGHAGLLLSVLPGFAWLVLLRHNEPRQAFLNNWLAVSCVVLPLCPYPVPGAQTAMGSLTLLVLLFVVLRDAIADWSLTSDDQRFCQRALVAIGVACGICLAVRATKLATTYRNAAPLDLSGAEHLRLDPEFVAQTKWTVQQLREHDASTFFCVPWGHNSLFCWSQIGPPTGQNGTHWQSLLREPHQREVVASLREHEHPVIVWDADEAAQAPDSGLIRTYIAANFDTVAKRGAIEIRVRRHPIANQQPRSTPSVTSRFPETSTRQPQ